MSETFTLFIDMFTFRELLSGDTLLNLSTKLLHHGVL